MSTQAITLTEVYQLVCAGACTVQLAGELEFDPAIAVNKRVATEPEYEKVFAHIGTAPPADDTFDYMEVPQAGLEYGGTENVYIRTFKGERIVKVTPVL